MALIGAMRIRIGTRNALVAEHLVIQKQVVGPALVHRGEVAAPMHVRRPKPVLPASGSAGSGNPTGSAGNQVSVVTHDELPADEELVASVKINADGEPVAKTQKDGGGEPIPSLLNPRKHWTSNHMRKTPKPGRRARKKRTSKKNDVQEHSGKYDVVSSLAHAPSRLTFGQLIRGDSDEAKKEIRRL